MWKWLLCWLLTPRHRGYIKKSSQYIEACGYVAQTKFDELQTQYNELKTNDFKTINDGLTAENKNLRAKVDENNNKIGKYEQEKLHNQQTIQELKTTVVVITKDKEDLTAFNTKTTTLLNVRDGEISDLKTNLKTQQGQYSQTQENLQNTKQDLRSKEKELLETERELFMLKKNYSDLKHKRTNSLPSGKALEDYVEEGLQQYSGQLPGFSFKKEKGAPDSVEEKKGRIDFLLTIKHENDFINIPIECKSVIDQSEEQDFNKNWEKQKEKGIKQCNSYLKTIGSQFGIVVLSSKEGWIGCEIYKTSDQRTLLIVDPSVSLPACLVYWHIFRFLLKQYGDLTLRGNVFDFRQTLEQFCDGVSGEANKYGARIGEFLKKVQHLHKIIEGILKYKEGYYGESGMMQTNIGKQMAKLKSRVSKQAEKAYEKYEKLQNEPIAVLKESKVQDGVKEDTTKNKTTEDTQNK